MSKEEKEVYKTLRTPNVGSKRKREDCANQTTANKLAKFAAPTA